LFLRPSLGIIAAVGVMAFHVQHAAATQTILPPDYLTQKGVLAHLLAVKSYLIL
jgi:hypothetical protein